MSFHFHENLRSLLDEKDLTQKDVAVALNISPSTFGGYVQGTREPDFITLIKLAQYFHVTTDYLLGVEDGNSEVPREKELLQIYRSLTKEQRSLYIELGKACLRFQHIDPKKTK